MNTNKNILRLICVVKVLGEEVCWVAIELYGSSIRKMMKGSGKEA